MTPVLAPSCGPSASTGRGFSRITADVPALANAKRAHDENRVDARILWQLTCSFVNPSERAMPTPAFEARVHDLLAKKRIAVAITITGRLLEAPPVIDATNRLRPAAA